jgi:hypothetical protein
MIRTLALVVTLATTPVAALAQSAIDPVNRVMAVAEARSRGLDTTEGYFDRLERDFSVEFSKAYREAQKYPAYDGSDYPFDYDVITSSQDGCPLEDVKISPPQNDTGDGVVAVSFRLWGCIPDGENRKKVSELMFDVVTENGKPVIADIHRLNEDKWNSLVAEMRENIRIGQEQP